MADDASQPTHVGVQDKDRAGEDCDRHTMADGTSLGGTYPPAGQRWMTPLSVGTITMLTQWPTTPTIRDS